MRIYLYTIFGDLHMASFIFYQIILFWEHIYSLLDVQISVCKVDQGK